uniref:Uncharacterized protein n=1 Tax=Romanomermis culicivorax TaxID=13658 RepID=A0A915ICC1_ROMCU
MNGFPGNSKEFQQILMMTPSLTTKHLISLKTCRPTNLIKTGYCRYSSNFGSVMRSHAIRSLKAEHNAAAES